MSGFARKERAIVCNHHTGISVLAETKSEDAQATSNAGSNAGGSVLVAVDFSADSEAALIWASHYANLTGARLLVLHVVHDPGDAPGYYRRSDEDALRPMEDVARELLEEFLETARQNHAEVAAVGKPETKLVTGIPATRILETAELIEASLIVMGSRGRTGLPHLLLGSKAERVAQMSPMPVTIVKAERDED